MLTSLETRYLKAEKWLPLPRIVLAPGDPNAMAVYYHPAHCELLIGDSFVDCANGIIALCGDYGDEFQGNVAHEFRHHWQFCRGWKYDGVAFVQQEAMERYKAEIVNFFGQSRSEFDALRYEVRHAPNDINLERMEWVTEHRNAHRTGWVTGRPSTCRWDMGLYG